MNTLKVNSVRRVQVRIEDMWNNAAGALNLSTDSGNITSAELTLSSPVRVASFDTKSEQTCPRNVTHIHRQLKSLWTVHTSSGQSELSPEHKHWCLLPGAAHWDWSRTQDLVVGAKLLSIEGSTVDVLAITQDGAPRVSYDLTVERTHAYYADGFLTHNSHTVLHLAKAQAELGYKTVVVPLEMSESEQMSRFLANATGLDSLRINLKRLADEEKQAAYRRFKRVNRKIEDAGGRFTIFRPHEDLSIEETLAACHSFNPDVVYIDYIGLLKGADGDDQWKKLGQIARYGKVYAGNHNKIVCMAAQVGDDGRIRYAQSIKEHSSLAFTFVANKETKANGFLNVNMLKGRNQQNMDFTLKIEYEHSRVRDLEPNELQDASNPTPPPDGKAKTSTDKADSRESYVPDLSE